MAKHKYIRKYLSKNGKWVYIYDDSTKSKAANKSNGSVKLDDWINARANARKAVNRAQTKIISKAVHMVDGKARYTYSKAKQSVDRYKKHPGYNTFIKKVASTAVDKAKKLTQTFGTKK